MHQSNQDGIKKFARRMSGRWGTFTWRNEQKCIGDIGFAVKYSVGSVVVYSSQGVDVMKELPIKVVTEHNGTMNGYMFELDVGR